MNEEVPSGSLNLQPDFSELAQAEVDTAYEFMLRFGYREAEQFIAALEAAVQSEVTTWRERILQPRVASGTQSSRTQYSFLFRTGGRRGSPWYVKYELQDRNDDGTPDTLVVVSIFHGASLRTQEEL